MKKIVTVTTKEVINDLREYSNITLAYPLKSFCVGYENEFAISEIDDFVLVNRILDDNDLNKLEALLKNSNIKGIIFDDLGIIDIVQKMNITKILLLDHLATNTRSINYYLEYVDSVVVSNDLTEKEIRDIAKEANKPLVINVFGLKTLMYSRRKLLSNYQQYYKLNQNDKLDVAIDNKKMKIIENEYGTKFYAGIYYNALRLLDLKNVLYFWYDPIMLNKKEIINVVINNDLAEIDCNSLFLDQATYYKVGEE